MIPIDPVLYLNPIDPVLYLNPIDPVLYLIVLLCLDGKSQDQIRLIEPLLVSALENGVLKRY